MLRTNPPTSITDTSITDTSIIGAPDTDIITGTQITTEMSRIIDRLVSLELPDFPSLNIPPEELATYPFEMELAFLNTGDCYITEKVPVSVLMESLEDFIPKKTIAFFPKYGGRRYWTYLLRKSEHTPGAIDVAIMDNEGNELKALVITQSQFKELIIG